VPSRRTVRDPEAARLRRYDAANTRCGLDLDCRMSLRAMGLWRSVSATTPATPRPAACTCPPPHPTRPRRRSGFRRSNGREPRQRRRQSRCSKK
jgi:hypothetical protein